MSEEYVETQGNANTSRGNKRILKEASLSKQSHLGTHTVSGVLQHHTIHHINR